MINYPCIQSLEVFNGLVPKLCHLLQILLFCSIMQQPDNSWKRHLSESTPHDKLFLCTKFGSNQCIRFQIVPFAANHVTLQHFTATYWFFWKRDLSESIPHNKLSLYTKFGSKQYISSKIMPFAANRIILQHFAATWSFFKDETWLNQLRMPNYPEIPNLVTMKQDYHGFLRGGRFCPPLWFSGRSRRCGD